MSVNKACDVTEKEEAEMYSKRTRLKFYLTVDVDWVKFELFEFG